MIIQYLKSCNKKIRECFLQLLFRDWIKEEKKEVQTSLEASG
jgi:hypothetical protein